VEDFMRITARQLRQIIREELTREAGSAPAENPAAKQFKMAKISEMHDEEENEAMYEGQRGNDENSQHDNDTDPGDPYARRLKETRNRAARRR